MTFAVTEKGEQTMELNREQIIKALGCCISRNLAECHHCPYAPENECHRLVLTNALSLINELTEENESLKQCLEHEHASFMETFGEYGEKCERLTEENERLRDTAYRLECEVHRERANTVRKMQERLHERKVSYGNITFRVVPIDDIDQIAKEMLEGIE